MKNKSDDHYHKQEQIQEQKEKRNKRARLMRTLPLTWMLFTIIRAVPIKGIANLADNSIFTSSESQSKLHRKIRCVMQKYKVYMSNKIGKEREETGLGRSVS